VLIVGSRMENDLLRGACFFLGVFCIGLARTEKRPLNFFLIGLGLLGILRAAI
jgi:hypothetical protein